MSVRQKLRFWAPFIFFFALIVVLIFVWYFTFPASAWEDTPNYLGMYLGFVAERPLDAFLTVSTGPGGTVSWAFVPTYALIVIHIILFMVGKQRGIQYTFLNKYYLVYLVLLGLFAISFQNASEHYGWYLNPNYTHVTTGKPAPGYVDTWTHITSPWLLGALIVPFALERYIGWDRKLMWLFMFVVLAIIALGWEIGETIDVAVNPSPTYFNYPMDSLKDMIMGAGIGSILSCWIYERLVTGLGERTWTSG
jgi:hypothetical protein